MLDLEQRGKDIRCFVHALEGWMIAALGDLGVAARREPGRIGIWTGSGADEAKIGAIGVRVKRWVTMHGFAINVAPELGHFGGIVPCGIAEYGVTSLAALGKSPAHGPARRRLEGQFLAALSMTWVKTNKSLEGAGDPHYCRRDLQSGGNTRKRI